MGEPTFQKPGKNHSNGQNPALRSGLAKNSGDTRGGLLKSARREAVSGEQGKNRKGKRGKGELGVGGWSGYGERSRERGRIVTMQRGNPGKTIIAIQGSFKRRRGKGEKEKGPRPHNVWGPAV